MRRVSKHTGFILAAAVLVGLAGRGVRGAASPADQARAILDATGVKGGLVVHLGCGDGALTTALRANESYLVHGLDTDAANIEKARARIRSLGLYGKVSVEQWAGRGLPYIDNLVNLLVADNLGGVPMADVMRVLAPNGVALVGGKKTVKPRPANLDEWTHHMYDATGVGAGKDTAVSRPRCIQWKAEPEYGRSHENMSSVSVVVSAGGRVFAVMDEGPKASVYLPAEWSLSARDAFSGVLLWRIPIERWHARLFPLKSGPTQVTRRLVASADRVFATLGLYAPVSEIDAGTGKVVRTVKSTAYAEELLLVDGQLVVLVNDEGKPVPYKGRMPANRPGFVAREHTISLVAERSVVVFDTRTGRTVWTAAQGRVVPLTMVADAGRLYFLGDGGMRCLDLATGDALWETAIPGPAPKVRTDHSPTVLVHKDIVYAAIGGRLNAFGAGDGKPLWTAPCAVTGYQSPASVFVVNGLIWDVDVRSEPYRPGTERESIKRNYIGYDLRTGDVRKKIPVSSEHGYGIMHHRCHSPRASGTCIITSYPGIEFFDVASGAITHDSWIRGACLYGFMPANGLLYTPPHPCACYTQGKLTGFQAVAGARKRPGGNGREPERCQKGPAFARAAAGKPAGGAWATYRGDAARSGTTTSAVPAAVTQLWRADIGGDLSQCIIADGKLFVASIEDHTVYALDAMNGKTRWTYTAGGRVDSAPTFYRGTVVFGSRDGYVYCLTAEKGERVWRFRAAPTDRRCVVYDQVESVWPVHGSVLIQDDVLWFCAGRSSYLDGGLLVYRLNPRTGDVLSVTPVDSLGPDDEQPPITPTIYARLDMEGAKPDVLSCDGKHVFMRHWAFDLDGKSIERTIDHLFSPTGFLDASWFRRTYWIYGHVYVSGAQGWARTGNVRPSGRILSIGEDRVYGFGRNYYPPSPGNRDQMYARGEQEMLFASTKATATTAGGLAGGGAPFAVKTKGPKNVPAFRKPHVQWSTPLKVQVRAMVLAEADGRLFLAGAKGDWITEPDAYDGRLGNVLMAVSAADGNTLAAYDLPAPPIFDGLSAADGRLYLVLKDGVVLCLGGTD